MPYQSGPVSLSIELDRGLGLGRGGLRPGREQGRRQIGDRPTHGLAKLLARDGVLLLLDGAHAQNQPCDAVGLVVLQDAVGKPDQFVDLAAGEHGQERAGQKLIVARIGPQRRSVIGGGGPGIALDPGVTRSQIVAGDRGSGEQIRRLGGGGSRQRRTGEGERGGGGYRRPPE